ncbi:MAG TPA: carbamoyl-phosphate synthase large subunit [Candidatus Omnitrophota bacterium]|nr:carbamoyl-phosphate synthase large subunit [Candidatus Omnitrophota bacterium]HQQ05778.1 carbamoyl-phosphate synthase large subunit [Candidatus Omnitrophota bacterium]
MPRRKDIKKVLMIGSGPIIIGQACEFDYSGSQACKALREEGYYTILVNSNPATIMTDPGLANVTYVEPLSIEMVTKIIAKERPDAILPTLGGQTGLNLAFFLMKEGVLRKYGVESIGSSVNAISCAEDRLLFKKAMQEIGVDVPKSGIAGTLEEGMKIGASIGFPLILRPAYCLGGSGGAIVYNREELEKALAKGLETSPVHQVLVEQSVLGWKEIEFEVMRDCADNVIIVTSMENVDPMGVHTGDSMVVAPAQTLTREEYVNFVNLCKRIIRKIGISGGGANIQFGQNPDNGHIVIIEVNPRLSRSSALASKATGLPIARVATKLAVGLTLPEVMNQITGKTTSFFEPTVDYCVFKICRFTFEKFPGAERVLNTSMKAVGEAMSIGRSFREALQKGIRSMEIARYGFGADGKDQICDEALKHPDAALLKEISDKLSVPNDERIFYMRYAIRAGMTNDEIFRLSKIDRWFIDNMRRLVETEDMIRKHRCPGNDEGIRLPVELLEQAKKDGFSDRQIAYLVNSKEEKVREFRKKHGAKAVYKLVDTCGGEFHAKQPYFYSTYETQEEGRPSANKKVVILGGGPNRIGQGIEFDYCCCHAAYALKEEGVESVMINCNPETVSTDYDTSDRLYFEPLTIEDIMNILDLEKPMGVIVQFGGQTPINLAVSLRKFGVNILGTSADSIDIAEDRKRFKEMLHKLDLLQPENGTAFTFAQAKEVAQKIGYPVLVRPSYVLGGRAMEIVYDESLLERFIQEAAKVSGEHPILIDKFLEDAIEVDVDVIGDGSTFVIGGIMEHIEEAGIHSGDSAMVLPTYTLSPELLAKVREATYKMAKELNVVGLMNVQYAIKDEKVYVLEVNPRASRTVPFVSKAIGVPLAKMATKIMLGKTLKELGFTEEIIPKHVAVKESVFPFNRFPGVDVILGPEMKSTGEVMGIDKDFGRAYIKSQIAAGQNLPKKGNVFISVRDRDKRAIVFIAKKLTDLGFHIYSTSGTAAALEKNGIEVKTLPKVAEGRPNVLDLMKDGRIQLVINTPTGRIPRQDEVKIRSHVVLYNIPYTTTISGAQATVNGIEMLVKKEFDVKSLQAYHGGMARPGRSKRPKKK